MRPGVRVWRRGGVESPGGRRDCTRHGPDLPGGDCGAGFYARGARRVSGEEEPAVDARDGRNRPPGRKVHLRWVSGADCGRWEAGPREGSGEDQPHTLPGQAVGVGAGQMSRVDSVKIGAMKAVLPLEGTVVASDAFFPFPDGVEEGVGRGATAFIQPRSEERRVGKEWRS